MSDETKDPTLYVDAISLNKPDRPYATGYVLPDVLAKSVAYVPASVADDLRREVERLTAEVRALTERAEKTEKERDAAVKELADAEKWGRNLLAKAEAKSAAVKVHPQATLERTPIGTRVLYAPSLGGKAYAGTIAGQAREVGGSIVVRLEDMEPAYGNDTGRPGRTTVAAASITNIFMESDE